MTPEKKVQTAITNYLHDLELEGKPIIYGRRESGGFAYKMGIADLWACINGYHVEIEVKAPGGQLRTMQEKWRDKCKRLNIKWCCVDSLDEFIRYLRANFSNLFTK